MTGRPLVAIGLPVYNGENFVGPCLDAIRAQSFQNIEIIISDNASTDGTQDICERHAQEDDRIRYHRNEENLGFTRNFNQAFALSTAPYFKWIAHDDLIGPDFVASCIKVLENDPEITICHSRAAFINQDGDLLDYDEKTRVFTDPVSGYVEVNDPPHIAEQIEAPLRVEDLLSNSPNYFHIFGLIRREALEKTAMFRNYYEADGALLVELALLGRFHTIEPQLHFKRMHPSVSYLQTDEEKAFLANASKAFINGKIAQLKGYLEAVWRSRTSLPTRLRCTAIIFRHGLRSLQKKNKSAPAKLPTTKEQPSRQHTSVSNSP